MLHYVSYVRVSIVSRVWDRTSSCVAIVRSFGTGAVHVVAAMATARMARMAMAMSQHDDVRGRWRGGRTWYTSTRPSPPLPKRKKEVGSV